MRSNRPLPSPHQPQQQQQQQPPPPQQQQQQLQPIPGDDEAPNLLIEHAKRGNTDEVEYEITANHINVNSFDRVRFTALHYAAGSGHLETVQLLIRYGANVDAQNNVGDTPLHRAAFKGHHAVVQALVNAKARIDLKNSSGKLPVDIIGRHTYIKPLLQPPVDMGGMFILFFNQMNRYLL